MHRHERTVRASNVGNFPGVMAEQVETHARPFGLVITLPPLATVVFKPQG